MSSDSPGGRRAYFEALYSGNSDPWRYNTGAYEIEKRRDTLSFLGPHYGRACEVGCSIGVLTQELAPRCDQLLGLDISPIAIEHARARLKHLPNVQLDVRHLPYDDLDPNLDLLLLSEMLYFLNTKEIGDLATLAALRTKRDADLLIVSFEGETQTQLDGKASTSLFLAAAELAFARLRFEQREHYHIHLLRRRDDSA